MLSTVLVSGDLTDEMVPIINVPCDLGRSFTLLDLFLYLQDEQLRILKMQSLWKSLVV